jgi:simple sugar transport system permease protein
MGAMTPLLFASLGGLFTELAGTLNIALEGLILLGAFAAAVTAQYTGSLALGLLAGACASGLLALWFGLSTLKLKANAFITGLATNLFSAGFVVLLSRHFFGTSAVLGFQLPPVATPLAAMLGSFPLLGPILFSQTWMTYLSWAFAFLSWIVLQRTILGMRMRATGTNSQAVIVSGYSPERYQLVAFIASGIACGLSGASLSLPLSAYVPQMSAGRGWIALVAIFLGKKKPMGIVAACFVFAFAESYSNYAQGVFRIPTQIILAIPYLATLAALILGTASSRIRDR